MLLFFRTSIEKFKGLKWISPSFQDPEKEINILIEMRKNLLKNINKKMLLTEYNFFFIIK